MRRIKKTLRKCVALFVIVTVFVAVIPLTGLLDWFNMSTVSVYADTSNQFDATGRTLISSGSYCGVAYALYDNGLLWFEDDTTGSTICNNTDGCRTGRFRVLEFVNEAKITDDISQVKYIFMNITARTSCYRMFKNCTGLIEVLFGDKFANSSSNITDMEDMYYSCSALQKAGTARLDTSNVTNMSYMFHGCAYINSLDVEQLDTSSVTTMRGMFSSCGGDTLDLSGFDTSKVTSMGQMFSASDFKRLDLSGFDTSNVTYMEGMFFACFDLEVLDISTFDMSKVGTIYNFITSPMSLHILKTPLKYTGETVGFDDYKFFYKLNPDNTVDRSVKYYSVPVNGDTSITLIYERIHSCSEVINHVGVCDICGLRVAYGDCNDDGKLDISDAVALKKHLAGVENVVINEGAATVNGDYYVQVSDCVKLMKHLAGIDVKLGVAEAE